MADLETIKIILRSHLISASRPLTVDDLRRDYKNSEGQDCPFRALGYYTWTAFLQALVDTVQILPNGICKAVVTKETQHVADLVALQKKPKRRPPPFRPPRMNSYSQRSYSRYPINSSCSSFSSNPTYSNHQNYSSSSRFPSYSSSSSNVGAGIQKYNSCYKPPSSSYKPPPADNPRRSEGWKRDCDTFFQQAREAKESKRRQELLQEHPSGTANSSTSAQSNAGWSSCNEFLQGSPNSPKFDNLHPEVKRLMQNAAQAVAQKVEGNYALTRVVPERGFDRSGRSTPSSGEDFDDANTHNSITPIAKPEGEERYISEDDVDPPVDSKDDQVTPVLDSGISRGESPFEDISSRTSCKVSDGMKRNLRKIIENHPNGIWSCELPDLYYDEFNLSLEWSEMGYISIFQMIADIPDVFVCKRNRNGDWKLFDPRKPLPAAYADNPSDNIGGKGLAVPAPTRWKIRELASKFPAGVKGEEFSQLYRATYSSGILTDAPGFKEVESLLLALQDSDVHLRYVKKVCYVYPVCKTDESREKPLMHIDAAMSQELGLFPEEVIGLGEHYHPPILPAKLECGSYVELLVAEVYTPRKFWIMLREYNIQLEKLMDDLQDFYGQHSEAYVMPESTISVGQCCVAIYGDEWHRAIVKSLVDSIKVEVLYVDYGTVATVLKSGLRFVHRDFKDLPKQAIRASLFGIRPPNNATRFAKEANHAFLKLVEGKHLVGLVHDFDREEPYFELFLVDTTGESDVHLNDVLVSEQYADFIPVLEELELVGEEEIIDANVSVDSTSPPNPTPLVGLLPGPHPQAPAVSSSTQARTEAHHSPDPPPGFQGSVNLPQASSHSQPMLNSGYQTFGQNVDQNLSSYINTNSGSSISATANTNPSPYNLNQAAMNPALTAALSAAYYPQIANALALQQQQQQQQQALLLALYQNLIQQNIAAATLGLGLHNQGRAPNIAAAPSLLGNPLLATPLIYPPTRPVVTEVDRSQTPSPLPHLAACARGSPAETKKSSSDNRAPHGATEEIETSGVSFCAPKAQTVQMNGIDTDSNSKSRDCKNRTKATENHRASATATSECPVSIELGLVSSSSDLKDKLKSRTSARRDSMDMVVKEEIKNGGTCSSNVSKSSNDVHIELEEDIVDCWEDLADDEDNSSESCSKVMSLSSSCTASTSSATSLQQEVYETSERVGSLSLYPSSAVTQTDPILTTSKFWKETAIGGKILHVFNIYGRGYVSTDELARKCTSFSTSSIVVRVLEHKETPIPFKKITRSENLPLFTALDKCPDVLVTELGLSRKEGRVSGSFHLTPLGNIPSMLLNLGISEHALIKEFQCLRNVFNPSDPEWST